MAVAVAANEDLRDAAEELGTVYRQLASQGDLPLDRWAIPGMRNGQFNLNSRILTALAEIYPAGSEGNAPAGRAGRVVETRYFNAYRTAMVTLREAARSAAAETLTKQVQALVDLGRRLDRKDMPERLHRIAEGVGRRVDGFLPSAPDLKQAKAARGEPQREGFDYQFARAMDDSLRIRVKDAVASVLREPAPGPPESHTEASNLCKVLSLHPEFVRIFAEYAISAKDGNREVQRLVAKAIAATAEFNVTLLVLPDHVWRYPPLIALGIKRLGLDDVDGFPEYAVDLGQIIGRRWLDTFLGVAGLVILLVGIMLTGPLAVTGVALDAALTGLALADLATTGASAGLNYVRDRERDIAAVGGGFSSNRIVERSDYSESALAAAATLMCGMAFVFSGAKLIKNWRARVPGTSPVPTGPAGNAPAARPRLTGTATASKAVGNRLGTRARPRSTEGERRLGVGPRWERRPTSPRADQFRLSAVGGAPERPTITGPTNNARPSDMSPRATDSTATAGPRSSLGGSGRPGTTATIAPPSGSTVVDTSFPVTPDQRNFPTKVLTIETEKAVGAKLESATGLKARSRRAKDAKLLREQIEGGAKSPPVTSPVLLKEPVITDPRYPAPTDRLASAKPDYLLLTPTQNEVFEVTMDSRFSIVPRERGLQLRGSAVRSGNPHKQIQVRKTLDYLIRRYPDSAIVYNIQTVGEVPTEVLSILRSELAVARKLVAAEGGTGSVLIVVRGGQVLAIY